MSSREEEISGVAVTDPEQLTPQGRLREAVTDDPRLRVGAAERR
jgi:hypothetical protein